MTSVPSLPAQIEALEPGWYWVRVFCGAPWHPYHWYHSRDGEAFWIGRSVDDEPMAEIGPRIPDPVTLQQHERLEAEIAEMEAGYQNVAELVLTYHGKNERLEAVAKAARDLLRHAGIKHPGADNVIVSRERVHTLEDALAALDTAAPDKPEDAERGLRRDG